MVGAEAAWASQVRVGGAGRAGRHQVHGGRRAGSQPGCLPGCRPRIVGGIRITGLDRVLAFKGELSVPLEHVRGVSARPEEAQRWFHGLKMPGSNLPGVVTAGTFLTTKGLVFYDMHHADRT